MIQEPILLNLPTQLRTSRLLLRVPAVGDGVALFEAVTESLPHLRKFLSAVPWVAADPSVEASETYSRRSAANFMLRTDLPFLIFEQETGDLVGGTGLHRPEWAVPKVEVGYWCRTSRQGRGYITEAVAGMVCYARDQVGAVRIELITDEVNTASRRVAERCGFALEGIMRAEQRDATGDLRDLCHYVHAPTAP